MVNLADRSGASTEVTANAPPMGDATLGVAA
jgi:hypothetical protein